MRYEPVAINIHLWETQLRYLMERSAATPCVPLTIQRITVEPPGPRDRDDVSLQPEQTQRNRVTVDAGSTTGSSISTAGLSIATTTSMPRVWQIFTNPADSAASVTKVWIWLR